MINILDELTINKISAGEVVERPSSAIKELIENSIDANSTKISIEIIDGGKELIKIVDNGDGISSNEVEKAFLRHATSKIKKIDDLYDLYSLGFRGEALASISAVSKVEMVTKTKDEVIGTKIVLHGGKIISKEPCSSNNGTIIIIRDIFFNTPARKKFLKSSKTEASNISDIINKLAISNPNIRFDYKNSNNKILLTPGNNKFLDVISSIHGRDIAKNLINIDYTGKIKINGYIGNNNIFRSNRNFQYINVNKRLVKSKILLDAILEAYKGILPINKHAICFLNIFVDPSTIDVNIHPTKLEVKFENENEVYTILKDTIRNSLLNSTLTGKFDYKIDTIKKYEKPKEIIPLNIESEKISKFENIKDLSLDIYVENSKLNDKALEAKETFYQESLFKKEYNKINFNDFSFVGTIFDTYIIISNKEKMYILDQHVVHEKILYEKYMNKFINSSIDIQILLDPIILQLYNNDISKIENNIDLFKKFGFEIEIFGNNHIMIRGVPNMFKIPESQNFILELIDNIDSINSSYDLKEEKIASLACKKAIKANDKISEFEVKSLLENLSECENPFTCPHGRPIIVEFTKNEIEKMFKRI